MGNRAVITTEKRDLGVYLHWNGGPECVRAIIDYCDLQGFRSPDFDSYGWARLCQVVGNLFGGCLSLGIQRYTSDECMNPGDNGIYVIRGWKVVEQILADGMVIAPEDLVSPDEIADHKLALYDIDKLQPEHMRLGADFLLYSEWVETAELAVGDKVYVSRIEGTGYGLFPVIDILTDSLTGKPDPIIALYDHNGDWTWNPNNHLAGESKVRRSTK